MGSQATEWRAIDGRIKPSASAEGRRTEGGNKQGVAKRQRGGHQKSPGSGSLMRKVADAWQGRKQHEDGRKAIDEGLGTQSLSTSTGTRRGQLMNMCKGNTIRRISDSGMNGSIAKQHQARTGAQPTKLGLRTDSLVRTGLQNLTSSC